MRKHFYIAYPIFSFKTLISKGYTKTEGKKKAFFLPTFYPFSSLLCHSLLLKTFIQLLVSTHNITRFFYNYFSQRLGFANNKVTASRKRSTASEEERRPAAGQRACIFSYR
jgi:hypothetical protein